MKIYKYSGVAWAVAALVTGFAVQTTAEAGNRPGRADRHASAPRWESKTVETRRTDTGRERKTTWTGANGKTATRDATVTRDKEAGTRTREVISTGPNGGTRTVDDVTTRTDNGYNRETVVTNPNGSTRTREATGRYDAETKTWTKEVTVDRDPPPASGEG